MSVPLVNTHAEGGISLGPQGPVTTSRLRLLHATSIGSHAHRSLQAAVSGRVAAVFDRSLYLELNGRWCCMAAVQLGKGPVSISVQLPTSVGDLTVGEVVEVDEQGFTIKGHFRVAMAGATLWTPTPVPEWSVKTLVRGLEALDQSCLGCVPKVGLADLVWSSSLVRKRSPEARIAAPAVLQLKEWLHDAVRMKVSTPAPAATVALVGLGPGLTPSGDDFLAGMLVALSLIKRSEIASRLYQAIQPFLTNGTNPVSCLHLAAAAQGVGSEMLHAALHTVLAGDCALLPKRVSAIVRVGQCSGWDGLAGAATVFKLLPFVRGPVEERSQRC